MKLTKEILWDLNFLNKFTNLRTSFVINLMHILVETRNIYRELYDNSWLNVKLNSDCYELFKRTDTHFTEYDIKTKNYFPIVVSKQKFHKPVLRSSKYNCEKFINNIDIKFEDGVKYMLERFFEDLKRDSLIEVFRIEITNFITKDNEKDKNELIEKIFKYLSDTFSFPTSPFKYEVDDKTYYIECVYNIATGVNNLNNTLDLGFTISFKLCTEETDTPITFVNDSISDFNIFYKEIKDNAKIFVKKQKINSKLEREMNKYL